MTVVTDGWQEDAISDLRRVLEPDPGVTALAVFGTAAQPGQDVWSDIDLLLVVEEVAKERFHPGLDWLRPLGDLYVWDQSFSPWSSVIRACFTDFRRIDFVITTEAALEQVDQWPVVPFWNSARPVFCRS